MAQSQLRGNKQIQSGSITNTEVASNANIALSKIENGNTISGYDGRVTSLENDAFVTREVPSGLINGSNVTFTLDNTPVSGGEQVYLNGLLQDPGAGNSYTISGSTITFLSAPLSGDEIHVSYKTENYTTDPNSESSPVVSSFSYGSVLSGEDTFAAADENSAAIRSDGVLLVWGDNTTGQLGLGDTTRRYTPRRVGSDTNWSKIVASDYRGDGLRFQDYYVALKTNGTLWAWGRNDNGQLGQGDTTQRNSPVQIGSDTNWSQVSSGDANCSAIRTNGTLWSWGYNEDGRLGGGTTATKTSPVQIGSDTNWSKVSCGVAHIIALKTNGTLWSSGRNAEGQLGLGDTSNRSSLVQIGSATNWSKIASSHIHTLAIKTDGTLWAWGSNGLGQLGDGTTTQRNSPVQIGTDTNWSKVFSSTYSSFAIKTDGTLWAWGHNSHYMLGDATATQRNSPVQIGTDTDWSEVRGGRYHTLASKTDGTLYAWGWNGAGELGNATNINKFGPSKSEVDLNS
jgi:alpha-tubulin suppressor-like RCC1 family protein